MKCSQTGPHFVVICHMVSYLGPLIFIILADDLRPEMLTHKFIDDTTVSETVVRGSTCAMQSTAEALIERSQQNHMNINCKKTKEMIIGPLSKDSVTPLSISSIILTPLRPKQQRDFGS